MSFFKALIGSGTLALVTLAGSSSVAAMTITTSTDANQLATMLLGSGIALVPGSASLIAPPGSTGIFLNDTSLFGGVPTDGVLLTSGLATNAIAPNDSTAITFPHGSPGSPFTDALAGGATFDAATLSFNIIPDFSGSIEWSYVFGSDEYEEFIGSFNDTFGLAVGGINKALIPGSGVPVSISNVNPFSNAVFYRPNQPQSYETQYDGLTSVLKATTAVTAGNEYALTFAIADNTDDAFDSGVFIKANSIKKLDDVPGPLPLFGALSAFAWSRKLRLRAQKRKMN